MPNNEASMKKHQKILHCFAAFAIFPFLIGYMLKNGDVPRNSG